jgi:hypothetical protein
MLIYNVTINLRLIGAQARRDNIDHRGQNVCQRNFCRYRYNFYLKNQFYILLVNLLI